MSMVGKRYPLLLQVESIVEDYRDKKLRHVSFKLKSPKTHFGAVYYGYNGPFLERQPPDKWSLGQALELVGTITKEFYLSREFYTVRVKELGVHGVNFTVYKSDMDMALVLPPQEFRPQSLLKRFLSKISIR
jgi:hypothetical protein